MIYKQQENESAENSGVDNEKKKALRIEYSLELSRSKRICEFLLIEVFGIGGSTATKKKVLKNVMVGHVHPGLD